MLRLVVLYLLSLALAVSCVHDVLGEDGYVHFNGYKVVRAQVLSLKAQEKLNALNLDVWSNDGVVVIGQNDIMVNNETIGYLSSLDVDYEVLIEDVEARCQEERQELSDQPILAAFHDAYHTYSEIVAYLQNITRVYPNLATFTASIGKSVEGRDIPAITITAGSAANKKKILFNGGQHAREWVSPATVLFIVDQLTGLYGRDTTVTNILNNAIFEIVPLVNPDGYLYTWSTNRLWRKNRKRNSDGTYGVDLNRNWDDHWGGQGSSRTPSSDTYCGVAPFSEPESAFLSQYVRAKGPFVGGIDFHSYSQLILRPYGWTTTPPPTESTLKTVGDTMRDTIRAVHSRAYTSQASWQLYYTTGSAQDWYFSKANIALAYTIELRDTGTYGFQLPANQIIPTGQENWAAVRYFANYIVSR